MNVRAAQIKILKLHIAVPFVRGKDSNVEYVSIPWPLCDSQLLTWININPGIDM